MRIEPAEQAAITTVTASTSVGHDVLFTLLLRQELRILRRHLDLFRF
jgi:hypothetical protein